MRYAHKAEAINNYRIATCACGTFTLTRALRRCQWGDNCPVAMRAHIADLERGQASIHKARAEGVEYGIRLARRMLIDAIAGDTTIESYTDARRLVERGAWDTPEARDRAAAELEKG